MSTRHDPDSLFGGEVELVIRLRREQLAAAVGSGKSRPLTVDQRTCAEVIGISRRQFLEACRMGAFPCRAEGKRRVALTVDVERYWTRGLGSAASGQPGALATSTAQAGPIEGARPADPEPTPAALDAAARIRSKYRLVRAG